MRSHSDNSVSYEEFKLNLNKTCGPDIDTILGEFYALTLHGEEDVANFIDKVISIGNIRGLQEV